MSSPFVSAKQSIDVGSRKCEIWNGVTLNFLTFNYLIHFPWNHCGDVGVWVRGVMRMYLQSVYRIRGRIDTL